MNFTEFQKMHMEFYFKIQYLFFDWKITITLLQSQKHSAVTKSDSDECYSESESATAHCSHSTVVSFNIVHNLDILPYNRKHNSNRQKLHVLGLHDVTATVGKTPLCKICWRKQLLRVHPNSMVLNFINILNSWMLLNFKRRYWILNC